MTIRAASDSAGLIDAALGSNPGRWPLAFAATPPDLWLRAVAAGGQGRYGSALADLDQVDRSAARGRIASLALSTRASFMRQLGCHDRARTFDGRALAVAGDDADGCADALIGLAADALGVGRLAAAARALQRAEEPLGRAEGPRLMVRHAWVSAELDMVCGAGRSAVAHAQTAADLAGSLGSVRHSIKSQVILAAALCCSGDASAARPAAGEALTAADRHGLIPLRWAAACLLADIGSADHSPAEITAIRDDCAALVTKRGGVWCPR